MIIKTQFQVHSKFRKGLKHSLGNIFDLTEYKIIKLINSNFTSGKIKLNYISILDDYLKGKIAIGWNDNKLEYFYIK
jgi:hypothetical protein